MAVYDSGMWQNKYSKDLSLSTEEEEILCRFVMTAHDRVRRVGISDDSWRVHNIALEAKISLPEVGKNLYSAMWIEFLEIVRMYISPTCFKYSNVNQFLEVYANHTTFAQYFIDDQNVLMEVANWMNILFAYESAKKKKGLVIDVVPRLIEGPSTRYVTGSGQTQATADRVTIYETEGGVKPAIRLKRRAAAKKAEESVIVRKKRSLNESYAVTPARKKAALNTFHSSISMSAEALEHLSLHNGFGVIRNQAATAPEESVQDLTDADESDQDLDCASDAGSGNRSSQYLAEVSADFDRVPLSTFSNRSLRNMLEGTNELQKSVLVSAGFTDAFPNETVPEQPVLVRQMTDRVAWLDTLMELGGPNNPLVMDADLDPLMFCPELMLD